jgi:hypothetical protein
MHLTVTGTTCLRCDSVAPVFWENAVEEPSDKLTKYCMVKYTKPWQMKWNAVHARLTCATG